jgi:RNA polymerase sigma-70 factor, ECF subfamily
MEQQDQRPPSLQYLELVTNSQRTLAIVLWSLLRNATDVEDVLQETNAVLWAKAHEYDSTREFLPWALKIAQLQVMAFRKRTQKLRRIVMDEALIKQLIDEQSNQEQHEPRRAALTGCLEKLPLAQRELILKRYEPESSVQELAAQLGRSPKALSESLRRIRATLLVCIERSLVREGSR